MVPEEFDKFQSPNWSHKANTTHYESAPESEKHETNIKIGQFDSKDGINLVVEHQFTKMNKIMESLGEITRAQKAAYPHTVGQIISC